MKGTLTLRIIIFTAVVLSIVSSCKKQEPNTKEPNNSKESAATSSASAYNAIVHDTIDIDGVEIFCREAGPKDAPTLLLLHGYPTSSHMFRDLMRDLSGSFHTLAPDYPGFGRSEQPPMAGFAYTFDHMADLMEKFLEAKGVDRFSVYLMDYGAPIGYRIAVKHPERIQGLVIQNGCAYEEGLLEFWDPIRKYWKDKTLENGKALEGFHAPEGLKWQYTHGTGARQKHVSPDNWEIDMRHLTRPENNAIQLAMFYDYQNNVPLYPSFQAYFREQQPPALIVYGKNDHIFPEAGAHAYKKDLKNIDFNLYDAGHFALETHGKEIASKIREFLSKHAK
jgi:pimeloyl-ACP methyl ester carboxylesterase